MSTGLKPLTAAGGGAVVRGKGRLQSRLKPGYKNTIKSDSRYSCAGSILVESKQGNQ